MKIFLTCIILISSWSLFSQISLTELQNILKMDQSKFETYCLSKGYEFNKIYDDENRFSSEYIKGKGVATKFLTLYERYFNDGKVIVYQTFSSDEYLSIKKQIESTGLKLIKTDSWDGKMSKDYADSNYSVSVFSGKSQNHEYTTYEITVLCIKK
jgi:hypothetical protein